MTRRLISVPILTAFFLFLQILLPTDPFESRGSHWIELVDVVKAEEAHELLKIYSVLKSHRTDLSNDLTWSISKTILEESTKHSFDPALILAVISVESSFQQAAISRKGARGFMQIRPFVANALAREVDLGLNSNDKILDPESLYDPILNIKLGVFYLNNLRNYFRDLKLALTAYNWGPTEIRSRIERQEAIPFGYATKVLSTYYKFQRG